MKKTNINIFSVIKDNKELIFTLTKREILAKYKGSFIGVLWPFITPIFMLSVYTIVFGTIFKARWNAETPSNSEFSLLLFIGLIAFNFFAEVITKSPHIILSNVNYVKKVIFPLEILSIVDILSGLFHALISLLVWLLGYIIIFGLPNLYFLLFPLFLMPFLFILLGFSWVLSAVGTYVKDIAQVINVLVSALMFLSPIFFPVSSLPDFVQKIAHINPLTFPIEQLRLVMYFGKSPNWDGLLLYTSCSLIIMFLGFYIFQKSRQGFPDVV